MLVLKGSISKCNRVYTELTAGGSNDADIATPTNEPER
jgi:hypothetical protein